MKKKCGTCRFFEDRGIAGSGTCQHEHRRELRDVVLVRQTELACRNSFDQDLWELSENPVLVAAEGASSGGIIPDPDLMFDLPAAGHGSSDSDGDVLDGHEPDDFTDHVMDVRMLGRRKTSLAPPLTPSASGYQEPAEFDHDRSTKTSVYDARQRLEEIRREAARRAHDAKIQEIGRHMTAGDADNRDDRPASAGLAPAGQKSTLAPIPTAGFEEFADFEFEPAVRLPGRGAKSSMRSTGGCVQLSSEPARQGQLAEQGTEPLPTEDVRELISRGYPDVPVAPREDRPDPRERGAREPFIHVDGRVRSSATDRRDKQSSQQLQSAERLDPIDRVERLATLQRCCATCRDFRQVGNEGRGWCSNPYAFGERRMVQSDQLACRSSLGIWWMPNDDVWLERADTSHHGRPTPLLDASLKVQRVGEAGRDSHA